MSAMARLARINRAREDKAGRARLQASQELAEMETLLADALARREETEARRIAAETTLASNPADSQALLWRRVAADALSDARDLENDANDRRALADHALAAARKEHDRRARQRSAIDSRLAHERLLIFNRRDELAADEFISGRVSAGCIIRGEGSA